MRRQVVIIGAGPAGLLLGHILHNRGIDTLILERRSPEYVLGRVRAGVLQDNSRRILNGAGAGKRMEKEGQMHESIELVFDGERHRIDFRELVDSSVMVYGQTEITRDLMEARVKDGAPIIYEAEGVAIRDDDRGHVQITYMKDGESRQVVCEFVAGCDGFHGVSRRGVADRLKTFERVYACGWLGLLVDRSPVSDILVYCSSARGFALCSQRSATLSRYYIQVPLTDCVENWSDQAFYDELRRRMPGHLADRLQTGKSLEKSIAPLRSFIAEPLRFGRLFLVGDAGHIVPPTGAKGLNLAFSDVHYLSDALSEYYLENSEEGINAYSQKALASVWRAEYFSWAMTGMMHRFPGNDAFDERMQRAAFDCLVASRPALQAFAENYTGSVLHG